jgi:hypothetical protein
VAGVKKKWITGWRFRNRSQSNARRDRCTGVADE